MLQDVVKFDNKTESESSATDQLTSSSAGLWQVAGLHTFKQANSQSYSKLDSKPGNRESCSRKGIRSENSLGCMAVVVWLLLLSSMWLLQAC